MDTTLMDNIITSGTTMLSSLLGALFTLINHLLPFLLGLAVLGLVVGVVFWLFRLVRHGITRR